MSIKPSASQLADLREAARTTAGNAYAPYSRFRVGAALLLSGSAAIVTGCNVENASFRLTTCAEQSAVASAIARYGPDVRIAAVAIQNLNNASCHPCGACLQTLLEFSLPETLILYPGAEGALVERPLADLIPFGFTLDRP